MHVIPTRPPDSDVRVTLPMPPDFRFSFSGSALPFPNEESSFEPSQAPFIATNLAKKVQAIELNPKAYAAPNWYYLNGIYGPPRARLQYTSNSQPVDEMVPIVGVPRIPARSLTPMAQVFGTTRNAPVLTQETLLRAKGMSATTCATQDVRTRQQN